MKSGASDPFADAEDDAGGGPAEHEEAEPEPEDEAEPAETSGESGQREAAADQAAVEERSEVAELPTGGTTDQPTTGDAEAALEAVAEVQADTTENDTESTAGSTESTDDDGLTRDELPFVLRRDRVKDERPEVHQLFVQRETHDAAVDAERDLQDRLDDDLSRTDAREAIYLAGMEQLDAAESILREWGYDL